MKYRLVFFFFCCNNNKRRHYLCHGNTSIREGNYGFLIWFAKHYLCHQRRHCAKTQHRPATRSTRTRSGIIKTARGSGCTRHTDRRQQSPAGTMPLNQRKVSSAAMTTTTPSAGYDASCLLHVQLAILRRSEYTIRTSRSMRPSTPRYCRLTRSMGLPDRRP